jgi:hypothetical protein
MLPSLPNRAWRRPGFDFVRMVAECLIDRVSRRLVRGGNRRMNREKVRSVSGYFVVLRNPRSSGKVRGWGPPATVPTASQRSRIRRQGRKQAEISARPRGGGDGASFSVHGKRSSIHAIQASRRTPRRGVEVFMGSDRCPGRPSKFFRRP